MTNRLKEHANTIDKPTMRIAKIGMLFLLNMEAALSNFSLGTILLFSFVPFSIACLFFGTQGGYYNTDNYEGDGTAHKVLK